MSVLDIKHPRWHNGAESRFMAEANGWVMVRRPGCVPYTVFKRDWLELPAAEESAKLDKQYREAVHRIDRRRE